MGVVMGEEKVRVPSRVLEEIEAVRQSGHAEMNDHPLVSFVANHLGYRDTAEWIYWHKKEYAEGVSRGFYTDPNADAVEEATPCWSVAASIVLRARKPAGGTPGARGAPRLRPGNRGVQRRGRLAGSFIALPIRHHRLPSGSRSHRQAGRTGIFLRPIRTVSSPCKLMMIAPVLFLSSSAEASERSSLSLVAGSSRLAQTWIRRGEPGFSFF